MKERDGLARDLAPSGRLRAALNLGNPILAHRDDAAAFAGVTVDLARDLAADLSVDVEFLPYASGGEVTRAVRDDRWDVAFLAGVSERAGDIRFTTPYLAVQGTCLVQADAAVQTFADLDRPGIRIAVGDGAAYHHILARIVKHAELVAAPTSAEAIAVFELGEADAVAGVRQTLEQAVSRIASRPRMLLDDFGAIEHSVALPRDRSDAAFAHVAAFIDARLQDGRIEAYLARDGQSSILVAKS